MNKGKVDGNSAMGSINLFDERWLPKISDLVAKFGETERLAIIALVEKAPGDNWDAVAKRIGITTRQLFNIRQNPNVQEAYYIISKELFKSDIPDVLKTLSKKAKAGEAWAVKLFLEVSGELGASQNANTSSNFTVISPFPSPDLSDVSDNLLERAREALNNPTDALLEDLTRRLRLSNIGVEENPPDERSRV